MFSPWVRKIPWRREWRPAPGFLPENSRGESGLVGYSPWGRTESDTTGRVTLSPSLPFSKSQSPPCRAQPSLPPPRPTLPLLLGGRSQELACWTSLVARQMKNLPASTGTQVRSLGRKDAACGGATQARGPGARALQPEQPSGERPERHSEEWPRSPQPDSPCAATKARRSQLEVNQF